MQRHEKKIALFVTICVSFIIFTPVFLFASSQASDFIQHVTFANIMKDTGQVLHVSNILFHAMAIAYGQLLGTDQHQILGTLPVLTSILLLCGFIFSVLWDRARDLFKPTSIILLTISMLIISPIVIWVEDIHMMGYINPMTYHSPTQNIMRLFVIPVSLFAYHVIEKISYKDSTHRFFMILLSAALISLASLGKPNYTIVIIPALTLYVLYRLWKREPIDWLLYLFGLSIPAVTIVGLEYLVRYNSTYVGSSSLAIGFLQSIVLHVPEWRIPIQFFLSLVFPLVVYAMYFPFARRDTYLNLSWLSLFVGAVFMYFVYEEGYRIEKGNFVWGAYGALFVLMFATLLFLLGQYRQYRQQKIENPSAVGQWELWRLRIAWILFGLHVVSGIRVYIAFMTNFQVPS